MVSTCSRAGRGWRTDWNKRNFGAKFLVDREGNVVTRFKGNPADKEELIKELLSVKAFL